MSCECVKRVSVVTASAVVCLLPVQDICSELLLLLHIKYTPHLQKKIKLMSFSPIMDVCKFI